MNLVRDLNNEQNCLSLANNEENNYLSNTIVPRTLSTLNGDVMSINLPTISVNDLMAQFQQTTEISSTALLPYISTTDNPIVIIDDNNENKISNNTNNSFDVIRTILTPSQELAAIEPPISYEQNVVAVNYIPAGSGSCQELTVLPPSSKRMKTEGKYK